MKPRKARKRIRSPFGHVTLDALPPNHLIFEGAELGRLGTIARSKDGLLLRFVHRFDLLADA